MKQFVLIIFCVIFCNLYVKSDDSIPTRQLDEVTVVRERGWIEKGVVNFIPSKAEKRLSNSPATLIKSMHLPFLKEKDGSIVNISGEAVTVFINGEKADDIDIATFYPKEVKRVQYIEHPSDPGYEGVKVAVNFIMPEYKVGGVSRVDLFQRIPNNGYYTASSKLVYKRMTYGVLFSGDYLRDHRSHVTGETRYKDIFYDGEKYETIIRSEDNSSYNREEGIRGAFNAKYSTDKMRMTHTISLGWNRNPGSGLRGINSWSGNLFNSSAYSNYSESSNLSPQISGNYYFIFSDKWYMSASWQYSYAKNKSQGRDQIGQTNPILNGSQEDVNTCRFVILPTFMVSKQLMLQWNTICNFDWYSTVYTGSAETKQNQSRQDISSYFNVYWSPSGTVRISFQPGISASLWQIGGVRQHTVNPTAGAFLGWNPGRKFSMNGALRLYMRSASASESNPVLVKSSELLWLLGNPYLKNLTSWDTYIYSTYLPEQWLSVSLGFGYVKTFNNIITTYTPASVESGGLIKNIINAEPSDNMRANIEIRSNLLDNRLSVGITPQWYYTYVRGMYRDRFNWFTLSGSADYTIGNFRIGIWYEGPNKDLSVSGMEKSWKHDNWNFSLTYGTGNLYLDLRIEDVFNNKRKSWIQYTSPNYISRNNYLETGRAFSVSITYTFGYGKKVDSNIDVNGPDSVKTSVLH